eukprot:GFUD01009033.1.p1 GENE.GFUD01009033.1~~GFUD01009033.1.p1  ORF type:complete len:491 (+),score=165.10 GFUD01009033.1:159-1475(+)
MVKAVADISHLTKLLTNFNVVEREVKDWQEEHNGVKVVQGFVNGLNPEKKTISVDSFGEIGFKKLCICSGGSPKLISDSPYVLGIRDTESVVKFQEKLREASRVVVVGNGGIATEMVYELDNVEIVWAIKDTSISSVFVDPGAGEFFIKELNKEKDNASKPVKRMKYTVRGEDGVEFQGSALGPDWHKGFNTKGCERGKKTHVEFEVEVKQVLSKEEFKSRNLVQQKIDKFDEKDFNAYVELSNGKVFGCDFVVSATGVVPCGDVFKHVLNVNEEGAIVIDDTMRTSHPDIYAAGDVCSAGWTPAHHWMQMRLWTQARQMGMHAAKAMVTHADGEELELDFCFEMFAHVTKFFGHKVVLLGLYNGQKLDRQYEVLLRVTPGVEYVKTVMKDGRMQGALLIGETDLEETFENLILNQLDLTVYGEDLLDPNIDIEDYFD